MNSSWKNSRKKQKRKSKMSWKETPSKTNQFKEARDTMSRRLRIDEDLRESYRANIAMFVFDEANKENGLDLTDATECNELAERLIKLIFDS